MGNLQATYRQTQENIWITRATMGQSQKTLVQAKAPSMFSLFSLGASMYFWSVSLTDQLSSQILNFLARPKKNCLVRDGQFFSSLNSFVVFREIFCLLMK